ncbi:heparan-alpha-glucosaminide N-acetyltransferase domain-containing protein [Candidatus Laterigemmans baculatus]|uniref:heparan-alpha-glucosaminide N-acetyltransferase domain-containing protein n=1 Tax=Candidatus Laterigemmans baculatus TaxID=2770505 RepID=UPI0013DCA74E|nr:heparan-alpha-glucosaminide N-acetyltransferase domain-containing protein [Candidatus Laterigemmans baculatus]
MSASFDSSSAVAEKTVGGTRILSLDQFRGYTVAGMLLVNFLASFSISPTALKHHHDYCSFADTIMPQFLFAVGFAFRLTFGRRVKRDGATAANLRMVRRLLGLMLVSVVIYNISPPATTWAGLTALGPSGILPELVKRVWFQTLMHIAVTSLWLLPVITASAKVRLAWMTGSAVLHVLLSYGFNYEWVNTSPNGIDGGPLGFLAWSVPAMMGTFTCDAIMAAPGGALRMRLASWGLCLMMLGYLMSCGTRFYDVPHPSYAAASDSKLASDPVLPSSQRVQLWLQAGHWSEWLAEPPFVAPPNQESRKWNYWMMSQRGSTLSYTTFCAGLSVLLYLLFYIACDQFRFHSSFLATFGTNALAAYVLHEMVGMAVKPFIPKDSPGWYVASGLLVFFVITWAFVRSLEKQKIFIRL